MSNAPAGPHPGWWVASDGNWYPPELHPDNQPQSAPGAQPPTNVQSGVTDIRTDNVPASGTSFVQYPNSSPPTFSNPQIDRPADPASYFAQRQGEMFRSLATSTSPETQIKFHTPQSRTSSARRNGSTNRSVFDEYSISGLQKGWETDFGKGVRKGIRTERKASTYLFWSLVMAAWYFTYFGFVMANPSNFWLLFVSAPGTGAFFAARTYYRIWVQRVHATKAGIGWTQEERSGLLQLKLAVFIATAAMLLGFVGNAIVWGTVGFGMMGGNGSTNQIIKLINPANQQQIGGSSTTTTNPSTIQRNLQQQLQNSGF